MLKSCFVLVNPISCLVSLAKCLVTPLCLTFSVSIFLLLAYYFLLRIYMYYINFYIQLICLQLLSYTTLFSHFNISLYFNLHYFVLCLWFAFRFNVNTFKLHCLRPKMFSDDCFSNCCARDNKKLETQLNTKNWKELKL